MPDYYALRPKNCMGGWGRQFFNISPAGKVLPCHAAETITGLDFESVRANHSIAWIWQNSEAFNRYPRHRLDAGAVPELRVAARSISAAAAARPSR